MINYTPTGIDTIDQHHDRFGLSHIVELRDHDPIWSDIFALEQTRLAQTLPRGVNIHHVGSTSISGLCAKPIIDMLITYPEAIDFEAIKNGLVEKGYVFREDLLPGRVYFVLENHEWVRYFAISVYSESDPRFEWILTFKENLSNNPALVAEYAALKKGLSTDWADRNSYMQAKWDFIDKHSTKAVNVLGINPVSE